MVRWHGVGPTPRKEFLGRGLDFFVDPGLPAIIRFLVDGCPGQTHNPSFNVSSWNEANDSLAVESSLQLLETMAYLVRISVDYNHQRCLGSRCPVAIGLDRACVSLPYPLFTGASA